MANRRVSDAASESRVQSYCHVAGVRAAVQFVGAVQADGDGMLRQFREFAGGALDTLHARRRHFLFHRSTELDPHAAGIFYRMISSGSARVNVICMFLVLTADAARMASALRPAVK